MGNDEVTFPFALFKTQAAPREAPKGQGLLELAIENNFSFCEWHLFGRRRVITSVWMNSED